MWPRFTGSAVQPETLQGQGHVAEENWAPVLTSPASWFSWLPQGGFLAQVAAQSPHNTFSRIALAVVIRPFLIHLTVKLDVGGSHLASQHLQG